MLRSLIILVVATFINFPSAVSAKEIIPDDIRYMLEDMYSADKNKWPSPRYKQDLNNDGFVDWVAVKRNCSLKEKCSAEIFICVPDKKGMCSEYCYIEVKSLINLKKDLKTRKCESTC